MLKSIDVYFNPLPADHNYDLFLKKSLVDQITVIGNEINV